MKKQVCSNLMICKMINDSRILAKSVIVFKHKNSIAKDLVTMQKGQKEPRLNINCGTTFNGKLE